MFDVQCPSFHMGVVTQIHCRKTSDPIAPNPEPMNPSTLQRIYASTLQPSTFFTK